MQVMEAYCKRVKGIVSVCEGGGASPATPLIHTLPGNTTQRGERCGLRAVTTYQRYRSCQGKRLARKNSSPTTASTWQPSKSFDVSVCTDLSTTLMATPSMAPPSSFSSNSCMAVWRGAKLKGMGRHLCKGKGRHLCKGKGLHLCKGKGLHLCKGKGLHLCKGKGCHLCKSLPLS